jgi:branched-chain amino acid transport system ATP-binding protein
MTTDTTTKDATPSAAAPGETVLDARGVTMRFGGLTAVRNVDLTVNSGEIVGLIGPNGAGKTTFFNCLTGLYIPTEGEVRYKGSILPPKSFKVTAAGIARTFQNIRLFSNMTVLENVLVGRHTRTKEGLWSALLRGPGFHKAENASRERAMELLEFVGLAGKAEHLARNLPYGEQRKLEIARALASEPGLLLLDEPTAGMNPQETRATEELVFAIRDKGIAVLVIEHDMRFIFNLCDRVAVLVQGEKLVEGDSETVQGDERVIAAYLGEPFEDAPGDEEVAEVEAAEAAQAAAAAPTDAVPGKENDR